MRSLTNVLPLLGLQGYPSGFPVLLPNSLSQQRSTALLQYLLDGNYLDKQTRQLTAEVVTYNAGLRVLGYTRAAFDWQGDGAIKGLCICVCLLLQHAWKWVRAAALLCNLSIWLLVLNA